MNNFKLIAKSLIGRPYWQALILASRIDSRDSIAHHLATAKMIESACDIEISDQTQKLRELMLAAEIIKNHTSDLFFRVLPSFLNFDSKSELSRLHPGLFSDAVELQKFTDKILTIVGGRSIHPIASVAGGFKSQPKKSQLREIMADSAQIIETALRTLRLFAGLNLPKTDPIGDFAALHKNNSYAYYNGEIWTGKGEVYTANRFLEFADKWGHFSPKRSIPLATGALARYNLGQSHFDPSVKKTLTEMKIAKKMSKKSEITLAKAIENYYFVILCIQILSDFVKNGPVKEYVVPPRLSVANGTLSILPQKFSSGTSAVESANGIVIHSCELDKNGIILKYKIDILNCC